MRKRLSHNWTGRGYETSGGEDDHAKRLHTCLPDVSCLARRCSRRRATGGAQLFLAPGPVSAAHLPGARSDAVETLA